MADIQRDDDVIELAGPPRFAMGERVNGWVLALPAMAAGTTLPITVEARRLSGERD